MNGTSITSTPSTSNSNDKIMEQTWKYPFHQISVLLDDADTSLQRIMSTTHCHIGVTPEATPQHTQSRMVQVTLRGTSEQIFAAHQQLNFVRQNGKLSAIASNKQTARFASTTTTTTTTRTPPSKLNNWNLDVSDACMRRVVDRLISPHHSTNWAILKFDDKTRREKLLAIAKYGIGGVRALGQQLAPVKDLTYCLLRFDYGVEIHKHQIILLIWSPASARSGQKLNIIPMLRHKARIKQTLRATFELNIAIHSYLNSNFILSELHLKHLVPEILLRVTKRFDDDGDGDDDEKQNIKLTKTNSTPSLPTLPPPSTPQHQTSAPNLRFSTQVDKFFVSKDWTLQQLMAALAQKYGVASAQQLRVTHILHSVVTKRASPSKFNSPRRTEHMFDAHDFDKTLSMLGLYHGSQIYVKQQSAPTGDATANAATSATNPLSNAFLAAQRRLQFTKIKTMSKTRKIKIKLKLSSHIAAKKSLQSLKQQKQSEMQAQQLTLQQKVSLRVERWEQLHDNDNDDVDVEMRKKTKKEKKKKKKKRVRIAEQAPTHVKQASLSDPEIGAAVVDVAAAAAETTEHDSRTRSTRTRSASTTDAYEMQKQETAMEQDDDDDDMEVDDEEQAEMQMPTQQSPIQVRSASMSLRPSSTAEVENGALQPRSASMSLQVQSTTHELKHDEDEDDDMAVDATTSLSLPNTPVTTASISSASALVPLSTASLSSSDLNTTEIECTLDLNEVFIVERSIGRGKTAHVHYAVYKNECDIALKEFRFGRLTDKILLDFHSELETLKKLDHENICRLLGHYVDERSKQLYLAFEWLPCGCLYDVLHDANVSIELVDVLEMAMDVARGMQYLHSQAIIHRDLKSHNLLLDEAYRVKITDFGTAKSMDKISGTTYTEVGTGGYCAPEVLEQPLQGYDRKVDVFSYGVLLWEILERGNVFDQRCLRHIDELKKGLRPKITVSCPPQLQQLIHDCWQFEPDKRPVFDEIVQVLDKLLVQYKPVKNDDDDEEEGNGNKNEDVL